MLHTCSVQESIRELGLSPEIEQQQDASEIPNGGHLLDSPPGFPDGLLVIEDDQRRQKIIVPSKQR